MALLNTILCSKCNQRKNVTYSGVEPDICNDCILEEKECARAQYLLNLKNLTLEQRISKIETELYDGKYNPPDFWDRLIK